jgi:hypothetical protein
MTARRSMIQYLGGIDVKNEAKESNNSQDDECIESPKISAQSSHLQFLCAVISWHLLGTHPAATYPYSLAQPSRLPFNGP